MNLASSITVAAQGTTSVPFTIATGAYDPPGELGFTITAAANSGASGSVAGRLVLEGEPLVPVADPEAHGVVVQILPSSAIAGQGTAANYVVRVINTGSTVETFTLSTTLPSGVSGALGQSTVEIQPGASNFRDITLRLTPQAGSCLRAPRRSPSRRRRVGLQHGRRHAHRRGQRRGRGLSPRRTRPAAATS